MAYSVINICFDSKWRLREWVRERILLSGTISFISRLEEKVFSCTFEQGSETWSDGSKAFSNMRILRNFMVSPISGAIFDAPFSLLLLIEIFFIHPLMGAFSLVALIVAFIIGLTIENKVHRNRKVFAELQNMARRELNLLHTNALYCNSMGNLPFLFNKWFSESKEISFISGKSVITTVIRVECNASNDGSGLYALRRWNIPTLIGAMSPSMAGNLIIAKFIGALAIKPTMMIVMGWSQVISARTAIKEIKAFIEESNIPPVSGIKLPPPNGRLVVSDVSFEYHDGGKKILDSISFKLEPGNVCAVLGDSGAGKSTLAKDFSGIRNSH